MPAKLIASALFCCLAGAASATNIVQNPGFEQGMLGWDQHNFEIGPGPLWAHTEPGMARLAFCSISPGCLDTLTSGAWIGQLLRTTAGDVYDLSHWVGSFSGESRLSVFWDGGLLAEMATPNGPMRHYSFTGLVASANATLLQLHGSNSLDEHLSFDDFSVVRHADAPSMSTPSLAVAEPGAYALLLAAMGALACFRRRER